MGIEEDQVGVEGQLLDRGDPRGLSLLSPEVIVSRKEALSPVSRFLSDVARAICEANPTRSLPPLSVMMRTDFRLDQLPSDEVGIDRLLTQVRLFVSGSGLCAPQHLNGLLRKDIVSANGPLVSADLTYQRT